MPAPETQYRQTILHPTTEINFEQNIGVFLVDLKTCLKRIIIFIGNIRIGISILSVMVLIAFLKSNVIDEYISLLVMYEAV